MIGWLTAPVRYNLSFISRDQVSQVTYQLLPSSCKQQSSYNNNGGGHDVISISPTGLVTSRSSSGTMNVLVTVHEDFGFNQTAIIEIEVSQKLLIPIV